MSEEAPRAPRRGKDDFDKKFTPTGTMFLMALYIIIIAAAWGSVYFGELLARR
jgi:hypothetical protein